MWMCTLSRKHTHIGVQKFVILLIQSKSMGRREIVWKNNRKQNVILILKWHVIVMSEISCRFYLLVFHPAFSKLGIISYIINIIHVTIGRLLIKHSCIIS